MTRSIDLLVIIRNQVISVETLRWRAPVPALPTALHRATSMLNVAIGFTVCLALVAVLRCWGLSRDIRSLRGQLNRMESAVGTLTRRLELRTSDERQRIRILEDITQGNRGQLKFLLGRLQRIETFLKHHGYETTTAPRGSSENVSRINLINSKEMGEVKSPVTPVPSTVQPEQISRYRKPESRTTDRRIKNMWGLGN